MGLWSTFANALGLRRPLAARHAAPFTLTDAAARAVAALGADEALHVVTAPTEGGRYVQVSTEPAGAPADPVLGIVVGERDRAHLAGLELDFHDGRWRVVLSLTVHASETPNPDGRLYTLDRFVAEGPPIYFLPGDRNPPLGRRLLAIPGVRSALVRDNTITLEREPSARWSIIDRELDATIREYLLLCGRPLTAAERPTRADPLEEAVHRVIEEQVLPGVHRDGGDIELVEIRDGVALIHMKGACSTCPASAITLHQGVERTLKQAFPGEITAVRAV